MSLRGGAQRRRGNPVPGSQVIEATDSKGGKAFPFRGRCPEGAEEVAARRIEPGATYRAGVATTPLQRTCSVSFIRLQIICHSMNLPCVSGKKWVENGMTIWYYGNADDCRDGALKKRASRREDDGDGRRRQGRIGRFHDTEGEA